MVAIPFSGHWRDGYCYNAALGSTDYTICFIRVHQFWNGTWDNWNFKQTLCSHSIFSSQPVLTIWIWCCCTFNWGNQRGRQEWPYCNSFQHRDHFNIWMGLYFGPFFQHSGILSWWLIVVSDFGPYFPNK